jgi:hypothetical protein
MEHAGFTDYAGGVSRQVCLLEDTGNHATMLVSTMINKSEVEISFVYFMCHVYIWTCIVSVSVLDAQTAQSLLS